MRTQRMINENPGFASEAHHGRQDLETPGSPQPREKVRAREGGPWACPIRVGARSCALRISRNTRARKLPAHAAIAIAAVRKSRALHRIPYRRFLLARHRCSPLPVVASTAHSRELAQPIDCKIALRTRCHLCRDDGIDARTPGPSFGRRDASMRRKAPPKKSSATCCSPILRCKASICRCAAPRSPSRARRPS